MPELKPGQPTDNVPHDVHNPLDLGPRATQIAAGVTLFTRDSSSQGNAIVVRETKPSPLAKLGGLCDFLTRTDQKLWVVETDFGNRMKLCDNEIFELYELGYQQDYETWWSARLDAIAKNID